MVWVALAAQAAQTGIGVYQQGKAARESLRTARAQQALDNEALLRDITATARQDKSITSQQRLAIGASGVAGGTAVSVNARDVQQQRVLSQEQLFRQLDNSLQNKRTQKDPISQAIASYSEAVFGKPAKQVGNEVKRVGKSVNREFKRFTKRLGF